MKEYVLKLTEHDAILLLVALDSFDVDKENEKTYRELIAKIMELDA